MTPKILNPEPLTVTVEVVGEMAPRQVVAIRGPGFADTHEAAMTVIDHYLDAFAGDFPDDTPAARVAPLVVHLPNEDDSIELLDEDDMRALGWVRAEQEGDRS